MSWRMVLGIGGLVAGLLALACESDPTAGVSSDGVGGPCADDGECHSDSFCLTSQPEGTCSMECDTVEDCPDGARCVSRQGGICLLACSDEADCRDGYACDDASPAERGDKVLVCID